MLRARVAGSLTLCSAMGEPALLDRYGSLVHEVLALGDGKPELLRPIEHAPDYLGVEAVYAASHEGAGTQSLSVKARISPRASAAPALRAAKAPLPSRTTY